MEKSDSIVKLATALVQFSGKMTKVGKDAVNPHFKNKYASLSNIIEGTQGALSECGLAVIQMPARENELTTILLHESGEYISETYTMKPVRNDPQGLGSAITYQRRYALGAILNLNIDEDDDGNNGSKPPAPPTKPAAKQPTTQAPKVEELPNLYINTPAYEKAIDYLINGNEGKAVTIADIEKKFQINKVVKESLTAAVKAAQTVIV